MIATPAIQRVLDGACGRPGDLARRLVFRQIANLRSGPLGEEHVNQRLGLFALDAFEEELALSPASVFECQRGRSLDRRDNLLRGDLTGACLGRERPG